MDGYKMPNLDDITSSIEIHLICAHKLLQISRYDLYTLGDFRVISNIMTRQVSNFKSSFINLFHWYMETILPT